MSETNGWVSEEGAKLGAEGRYVKMKDWPTSGGARRKVLRILSRVFAFYEGWSGGKPIRASKMDSFPPGITWDTDTHPKYGTRVRTPALQWGVFCAYNDQPDRILFWQIGQVSIQRALLDLAHGAKGAPTKYDIEVVYRENAKPPYSIIALDSSEVNPVTAKAFADLVAAGADTAGILTSEGPFPRAGVAKTDLSTVPTEMEF